MQVKKMRYAFRGAEGRVVVVQAINEAEARDLAMRELWGDRAPAIGPSLRGGKYAGSGLVPQLQ